MSNKSEFANHPKVSSFRKWDKNVTNILTPLKAIREQCEQCSSFQPKEIELCVIKSCGLYPYRFGKNPGESRQMTDEQKEAATQRLRDARMQNKQSEC